MRIIFVDDEPKILDGLRRILRPQRKEWDMDFYTSAQDALDNLKLESCDVVVSDMKMPGMDGAEFLSRVREIYPDTIRIALSGQSDSNMIYRCIQNAHQYMAKPCDIDTLTSVVQRARMLRELLEDDQLRATVSSIATLPSLPDAYSNIMEELQSEFPSLNRVGQIVETDLAMSAKLLQIVNSSFFGLMRTVSSPVEAATYLGVDVIQSLALTVGVFSQFEHSRVGTRRLGHIWQRSIRTGALAKHIMKDMSKDKVQIGDAMMGGLLSNIGTLVIAANFADEFVDIEARVNAGEGSYSEVERAVIGCSQSEIGAYLLCIWGLANPVVESVVFSDAPSDCIDSSIVPLTAVHIASVIVDADGDEQLPGLDRHYVEKTGVADKVAAWVEAAEEISKG